MTAALIRAAVNGLLLASRSRCMRKSVMECAFSPGKFNSSKRRKVASIWVKMPVMMLQDAALLISS